MTCAAVRTWDESIIAPLPVASSPLGKTATMLTIALYGYAAVSATGTRLSTFIAESRRRASAPSTTGAKAWRRLRRIGREGMRGSPGAVSKALRGAWESSLVGRGASGRGGGRGPAG